MFFLSSTTHVKKMSKNVEDKFIRNALISIWGLLFIFGFISTIQPQWLKDISSSGKLSEARDLQSYGDQFLKSGDYKSAISLYTQAINIQPDLYTAIGNLGITHLQLKNFDKSIKLFKHLLKKDTEHIHTNYYNLAEVYRRKGEIETAISYYIKSAENNPFPIYSYQFLAELYYKLQKWDLMIDSFQKALKNRLTLENSYYGMLQKIDGSSIEEPEIHDAIKHWQEHSIDPNKYDDSIFVVMLNRNKDIAKIHNFLGIGFKNLNKKDQAISHFKEALNIWPNYSEAKQNLEKLNAE